MHADLHPKAPCNQPFNKKLAVANSSHKSGRNLERRLTDYSKMIDQRKIGDGHRDANGYPRPGSNKK